MSHPKPWSRADYDLLEARLTAGHRYADIADEMGARSSHAEARPSVSAWPPATTGFGASAVIGRR